MSACQKLWTISADLGFLFVMASLFEGNPYLEPDYFAVAGLVSNASLIVQIDTLNAEQL